MPLRSLRPNRSERDLKRRSTLDPAGLFRRGDKDTRNNKSSENLYPSRIADSEDGNRPVSAYVARPSTSHDDDSPPSSPPVQEHTPNTKRFSLMRFRHASDSQLSTKAKEQQARDEEAPPPVPAVPANPAPPAIITTAPTVIDQEEEELQQQQQQQQRSATMPKRSRMQQFALRRRSFDPTTGDRPSTLKKSMDKKRKPLGFKKSQVNLLDESERPSTSSQRPVVPADSRESVESTTSSLAPPATRASESSRSDGSSGGHISFETTQRPPHPAKQGSARFNFGRRKQRASLFPLPMKIEPPQFPDTAPATPRASTGGRSSASTQHSPTESPPLTARRLIHGEADAQTPPVPSPSQVAQAAGALNLASPGSGTLFRNDSYRSTTSAHSSPNANVPSRLGLRGRSSTMGSLSARSDDAASPTPPGGPSGRTSMSTTAGRTSFSNLFGLGSRFRQNSEPHSPRHVSPAHGFLGNSALSSHQNSMNISRETLILPEREEGETPGRYLERIEANNFDKSVVASYLSKTDDPFMLSVLRSYMRKFAFFGDPIDMAIRKLLMQVELPKETQQIDRVLQGFADRYHECNPGIYINTDKAYFISFSIIILHTDVFNKNNKRKMQRSDYIKNSSCDGVSDEVLGCFYDNIVYTPFIHIEDEVDLKNITSKKSKRTAVLKGPMNDPARKAAKEPIDPYTLIFEGKLDALRPTIRDVMHLDDPYNYVGTAATLDNKNIYKLFSRYGVIQIVSSRSRPEAFMSDAAQENPFGTSVGIVEMPVTKVGVLWRKDTKKKKARSPWQEWGAVLTRSGLSLFRNSTWTRNLMTQHDAHLKRGETGPVVFQPALPDFKQDHIIPMDGAVALVDNTYKKHKNAFVMFSKAGEETFLADSEKDLNEWLGVLNYTASFETLGVRSRGMIGGLYEGQKNRGMRRLESSHSTKTVPTATGEVTIQSGRIDSQFAQQMMNARKELMQVRISESEEKLAQAIKELEARLRDARHLQILAPIQPKSRELVIHAAGRLSAKLKWTRIEIWRMKCHRDILAQELEDEKQGFIERQAQAELIEPAQPQQQQLSPQHSNKGAKTGGLARLTSKTSSITSGTKPPPLSPGLSVRPGTKSSRDTEFGGEEAYKTPPETSRQSSPRDASGHFQSTSLSFSPPASDRRSSLTSSSAQSPRLYPSDHRPSISTTGDGTAGSASDSDSDSEDGLRYTTPPPGEARGNDSEIPEIFEISPLDGARPENPAESDSEQALAAQTGSPASRTKQRRSLHRTLRDSHGNSSHRRSHKGRDSASTIASDMTESEGLARGKGSFTVHGKKASVIQFGSDWHNTTAEERLKTKKQLQEAAEAASADERDGNSIASAGTATARSPGSDGEHMTPRKLSVDTAKQRHVSSQTITPANFRESFKIHHSDSGSGSDMSDIEEETKSRTSDEQTTTKGKSRVTDHMERRSPSPRTSIV